MTKRELSRIRAEIKYQWEMYLKSMGRSLSKDEVMALKEQAAKFGVILLAGYGFE